MRLSNPIFSGWVNRLLLFLSCCLLSGSIAASNAEYDVKAALLFKLSRFISWPESDASALPMTICIYGKNPFGKALNSLQKKASKKYSMEIRHFSNVDQGLDSCHILFISQAAARQVKSVLLAVSHSPVLTVSDIRLFADSGGMVEFSTKEKRISFRINLQAAKNSDIKLASPLLELATIVSGAP